MTILDLIEQQLGSAQADQLGQQVGLAPTQARTVLRALVPLHLSTLIGHAQTAAGAQQLLDLSASTPGGTVQKILSRPGAAEELETLGNTLAPTLPGTQEHRLADQVAAHGSSSEVSAVNSNQVQRLGRLSLPLLLGLIGQWTREHHIGAAELGSAMLALRPHLTSLIPASLAGLLGGGLGLAGATGTALGAAQPNLGVPDVNLPSVNVPNGNLPNVNLPNVNVPNLNVPDVNVPDLNMSSVNVSDIKLPSVNMSKVPMPSVEAPSISTTSRPLSTPLPNPPSLGTASLVGETQRRGAGWLWALPLALLLGLGGCYLSQQNQKSAVAPPVANPDTAGTTSTAGTAAAGTQAILAPATGGSVPAGAFDLSGTGKAGEELEVFEDGKSVSKATVGEGGNWTLNVPSPAEGKHTYEVKIGTLSATSAVTVGAATAATTTGTTTATATTPAGECTKDYTLSLKDGQSVSAPFRFGGVGAGKGYNVTVMRAGRTIGTKPLPLNASCGWSYDSAPGKGDVTYIVKEGLETSGKQVSSVTLKVQ